MLLIDVMFDVSSTLPELFTLYLSTLVIKYDANNELFIQLLIAKVHL